MRTIFIRVAILSLLVLSACSSPDWKATILPSTEFKTEQPILLTVEVMENGKPVTGLNVKGELEMVKMDHGTLEVDFKESGNGKYEGNSQLPMEGEWNAILEMTKGNITKEQTVTFEVQ
jgi:nitrogen fixation protein FixH